ncbi:uncharacterized protein HI_0933 isoform X5 [Benincasa hispida]|uniref:uncharacterized protein HI_0933 isoform X5 n=1 Tax=Benincasa hispida TaxID=102211 RepID=UPI00190007DB|nr:uncharacterized protein HI_0933 isoform X5 [Benincasa hispida]
MNSTKALTSIVAVQKEVEQQVFMELLELKPSPPISMSLLLKKEGPFPRLCTIPIFDFTLLQIFFLILYFDNGQVKISGGGRCNVTNGHCTDAKTGKVVTSASVSSGGKFALKIQKLMNCVEHIEANYLLIASGSSRQGFSLAAQFGHSLIDPVPSLFTFKIEDPQLAELSGVSFPKVRAKLKLENIQRHHPQYTQVGPMLVTHWGLSGPVILRLSAWGARDLFTSDYKGLLIVDFTPDLHLEDVKTILSRHKSQFMKQKVHSSCPSDFGLVKRFWKYLLDREEINDEILWASISNKSLASISSLLKQCIFKILGKGQFKDEFVTAGGVPLSEISLKTMESKIQSRLFFAGEVLNVDGVTGGFNFQNAWSGGYIAGTSIGKLANGEFLGRDISNLA